MKLMEKVLTTEVSPMVMRTSPTALLARVVTTAALEERSWLISRPTRSSPTPIIMLETRWVSDAYE